MNKAASAWQHIHSGVINHQRDFIAQLDDIESVQKKQLLAILKSQAATPFGRKYQFSAINMVNEFVSSVPIHRYEDTRPYLENMAAQPNANIICFEQTSGSTQAAKLIPYTQHSGSALQSALYPWLDDLLIHRPGIKKGTAYWSISPALRAKQQTKGGHAIGLKNDALYFGEPLAKHITQTLAVPAKVANTNTLADWRYQTLRGLLYAEDLSFISVWSPTFLLELMHFLPSILERLLADIQQHNPSRAAIISASIMSGSAGIDTYKLWPALDTISCWTEGTAASFIPALRTLFPHAFYQGKGLLATEGVVTLPLCAATAPVLAVCSGFYEFIDKQGQVKLAHQLELAKTYQVLMTNYSGLYRYHLGDKVQVKGFFKQAPMLSFIGRGEHCSDLCGEKLNDAFVAEIFTKFLTLSGFRCLCPQTSPTLHYALLTDAKSESEIDMSQLDAALSCNPQYHYARKVGQLQPPQHIIIQQPMQRYTQWHVNNGGSIGDIKAPCLITDPLLIKALI